MTRLQENLYFLLMPTKNHVVAFEVMPQDEIALELFAKRCGTTKSHVVRMALREWLSAHADVLTDRAAANSAKYKSSVITRELWDIIAELPSDSDEP